MISLQNELEQNGMTEESVVKGLNIIRNTGLTNMLDLNNVLSLLKQATYEFDQLECRNAYIFLSSLEKRHRFKMYTELLCSDYWKIV